MGLVVLFLELLSVVNLFSSCSLALTPDGNNPDSSLVVCLFFLSLIGLGSFFLCGDFVGFVLVLGMALLEIKSVLNDTRNALSNWKDTDNTPCQWTGISCNAEDQSVVSMYISLDFSFSICLISPLSAVSF